MPIGEADPWRMQYFSGTPCPDDVLIPTEDCDAWELYPDHRWVYNKIAVALSQGIAAAPHGVMPKAFPVFSKPMMNLHGMGIGSRVIATPQAYVDAFTPGYMWMRLLQGEHVSTDVAVVDGEARWWRHATGVPAGDGTFDHWWIHAEPHMEVERYCGAWSARHLKGYTGMVNFETIGGRIIETHLRFADQWPDLYGPGWVEALVRLYVDRVWSYGDRNRRDGYSVVLFGPHGRRYRHPPEALQREVRALPGVSSLQITFHAERDPALHAMPPGGFRLAIVNATDLAAGRAALARLRAWYLPDGGQA
jgi:hypothetical protein